MTPLVEIRIATTDDKPRLLQMAAKATAEVSPFPGDPSAIEATADKALSDPDFLVLAAKTYTDDGLETVGFFCARVGNGPFSVDRVAEEIAAYVEPEYRDGHAFDGFLSFYETWARNKGAKQIRMPAPRKGFERVLERRGYSLENTQFYKTIYQSNRDRP